MPPIVAEILVSRRSTASGVYGLSDVLSSVGTVWESVVARTTPEPRFALRFVSTETEPFECATGGIIAPHLGLTEESVPAVVIVPGISAAPTAPPNPDAAELATWLRLRKNQGASVVSACTGALLLAQAGLLDGEEATTHWAFRDHFREHYPKVRLRVERNLCIATGGIVTSGGTTAWQQLALYLIERYCGREHALRAAKFWLLPDSGEFQAPYAVALLENDHDDQAIRNCQTWIVENCATDRPVESMMEIAALPPTTFARRFRRATGYTPMEFVHGVRIEEAKRQLESSERRVDTIGRAVGYEDTASFRRLFKRQTGLTPRDYRHLFGPERFRSLNSAHDAALSTPKVS